MRFLKDPGKIIGYLEKSYTMKGLEYPQLYLGEIIVEFLLLEWIQISHLNFLYTYKNKKLH